MITLTPEIITCQNTTHTKLSSSNPCQWKQIEANRRWASQRTVDYFFSSLSLETPTVISLKDWDHGKFKVTVNDIPFVLEYTAFSELCISLEQTGTALWSSNNRGHLWDKKIEQQASWQALTLAAYIASVPCSHFSESTVARSHSSIMTFEEFVESILHEHSKFAECYASLISV